MKKALSLLLALMMCLSLCACGNTGVMGTGEMLIFVIGVVFAMYCAIKVVFYCYEKKYKKYREITKDSLQYNERNKTLTVNYRMPENAKSLECRPVTYEEQSTSPKELVYTSASSGGVTIGGFDVIGGNVKKKTRVLPTSKCFYCGNEVEIIELSSKVFYEALDSSIRDFLDGDTIIIKRDMSDASYNGINGIEKAYGRGSDMHMNVYHELEAKQYRLKTSELQSIIKWLGGDTNQ